MKEVHIVEHEKRYGIWRRNFPELADYLRYLTDIMAWIEKKEKKFHIYRAFIESFRGV